MKHHYESYLGANYQHPLPVYSLELANGGAASALGHGLYHQVENWVALELTAEQMLADEFNTVTTYVSDDAKQFWGAVKDQLLPYELAAAELLISAADPTQVEWSRQMWWGNQAPH